MLKWMARIGMLTVCASCWTAASAQSLKVFMLPGCPVTRPAEAAGGAKSMAVLTGIVLEQIISKGVDIASSALTAAAKDTVAETSEASAFLKALASAFAEDKDKLKTALNDRLNPVRREELEAEKTASDRSARQKYQLALLKVSQIDASLQEASGGTLSSRKLIEIQLVQAKIDANAAARAAGVPAPFADYD